MPGLQLECVREPFSPYSRKEKTLDSSSDVGQVEMLEVARCHEVVRECYTINSFSSTKFWWGFLFQQPSRLENELPSAGLNHLVKLPLLPTKLNGESGLVHVAVTVQMVELHRGGTCPTADVNQLQNTRPSRFDLSFWRRAKSFGTNDPKCCTNRPPSEPHRPKIFLKSVCPQYCYVWFKVN